MKQLILHIPHTSTTIPDKTGYVAPDGILEAEILKLTDWYTDDLYHSEKDIKIIAPFSRIFCDVERFADDDREVMARQGMGVLYEKSDEGEIIRKVDPVLRQRVLENYYYPHHQRLTKAVQQQLKRFGKALIIDCHSFPDRPFKRDLDQHPMRPDFALGTDAFHTPKNLEEKAVHFFRKKGYSIEVNRPYSGTLVPEMFYQKNQNVQSLMLEINRKLYLKGTTNKKSKDYTAIKRLVSYFLNTIRSEFELTLTC